ncbi:RDD domain containing protein [Kribbella flavida DSM 17836]|uniref:RDD domain containing protein n=1 Tax=Kribbella flavida (strain DSM 17836 / JCM 10339 / NBRC 14399) TaxID=479435 RepID=D2Q064_KRIFD|nr:RDD family protein [Kribbella flavida]ADB30062.1 RDD domain containing protein [Kribbella flavida DSM 17836]
MSTPPFDPNSRPQDQPPYPGQPNQPAFPNQPAYPDQPGFPNQPAYPNQPGGYGPQYNPSQPGYNPYAAGGGYGFNYAPPGELAGWGSRVVASILDSLLAIVVILAGVVVAVAVSGSMETMSSGGTAALVVAYLAAFAVQIWNRVIRQGRTGQSLGKKVVGLKVVSPETGELIGMGRTLGREVCAVIFNNFCFLNVLWPLWDDKSQTWHDKVAGDIVIKV